MVAEELQRISLGDIATNQCFLALHQFHHLLFDSLEVSFADDSTLGGHHVVVESALDGGTDTELCARVELLKRFGHQVGTRVPEGVLTLLVVPFVEHQLSVLVDGAVQFDRLSVDTTSEHIGCQSG